MLIINNKHQILKIMTKKDKKIISEILAYIGGSESRLEKRFAEDVGKLVFDMSEEEFSDWLCQVKIN